MAERDPQIDLPADEESAGNQYEQSAEERSLADDILDLIEDGKTYAEAELQFQKSRVAFVADKGRKGAVLAISALLLLHLAVVTLALGAVIALSPTLTPWGATGLVVGALIFIAILLGVGARRYFSRLGDAFGGGK
ncbi:MAG: phage holin family protein [Tsuneonella suprasediminis]|uniref:phage holin family protein n=1 Tax=Tsuneonella suprasediminis TaxID=2306996 RepID=UPI0014023F6C|nr:phage holin family protein [Tsuneonella suprasediminis]UBS32268.1 phage holin family protein [Altererythrobacter sp. N1]